MIDNQRAENEQDDHLGSLFQIPVMFAYPLGN